MQTLHNLAEGSIFLNITQVFHFYVPFDSRFHMFVFCFADELAGFKQTWNGNADRHIPGWESGSDFHANAG